MLIDQPFIVNVSTQALWDFLFDIPRMSVCMPGVEKVEAVDEQTYRGLLDALKLRK